jgi:cyclic pyranopterin phosphate synthase
MDSALNLSHVDERGKPTMVDVSHKGVQRRTAIATGRIRLTSETVDRIKSNTVAKGSVLDVARIAGIQGAKRTSELIPLCHPLPLGQVWVDAVLEEDGVEVTCKAVCIGQTGVEMEALTGVSVALLTVYDMCKAVDKTMIIEGIRLVQKIKEEP